MFSAFEKIEECKMRKKILIVSHAMEIGGAERALLGLLENIDTEAYQVDLFLLRHEGELYEFIPNNISILPEIPAYTVLAKPMVQTVRKGHFLLAAARVHGKYKAARYDQKNHLSDSSVALEYSHKYTKKFMPRIQPGIEYDLAISFLTPHYFVAEKVCAKKKVAWIHTDYSVVQVDEKSELTMWNAYDNIASISDDVTAAFLKIFPSLKNKIVLIENILPKTLIEKQSNEVVEEQLKKDDEIMLLSIGRFSTQKNFDNVPDICRRIVESGLNVQWYLIGYGQAENLIREKISESKMENHVHILGKKTNPYPYVRMCDAYIQPSRYEGKCVAVREAQMLGKLVIITNYATSGSQLKNGVDGVIVPMENEDCANGIISILENKELRKNILDNVLNIDYTNAEEIKKIYKLIKEV